MLPRKISAAMATVLTVALCAGVTGASARAPREAAAASAAAMAKPPNVVFVLMDDFSVDLLKTMRNTTRLKNDGVYFPNAFVADSLCCTSRSALLTGRYPHHTKVRTNSGPQGGWQAFKRNSNGKKTFAYALNQRDGRRYRTALQGKFLNKYEVKKGQYVPPGWTQWNPIGGAGYQEWKFPMAGERTHGGSRIGDVRTYKSLKDDGYATNVLARRAVRFIDDSKTKYNDRPYFLELAPYGTHQRLKHKAHERDPMFPAALADRPSKKNPGGNCGAVKCRSLRSGDLPGFDDPTLDNRPQYEDGSNAPHWQNNKKMGKHARKLTTKWLRDRARQAQSIDRMVGRIRAHAAPNTYIVVTSDNGYHLGQHRARNGKGTAYDSDIRVPLIVYKKTERKRDRLPAGVRNQVVSNIDLAATFRQIGRTKADPGSDGVSLFDALWHPKAKGPRYTFVEHTQPATKGKDAADDPDHDAGRGGTSRTPSYQAVRSADALLVRYRFGDRYAYEYYRYHPGKKDGMVERTNTYTRDKNTSRVKNMEAALQHFANCEPKVCRATRTAR